MRLKFASKTEDITARMADNVQKNDVNIEEEKSSQEDEKKRKDKLALRDIRDFCIKLAFIVVLGWVLLGVVFGVAVMEGEDMYPRLRDGDLMVYYRLQQDYHIGDVVTFKSDDRRYTGRIVAQGGDTVDITEEGELIVNGSVQSEEIYYPTEITEGSIDFPCEVPQGSVFLLCDFRTTGYDSRNYGPVEIDSLDGKVITILRRRGI